MTGYKLFRLMGVLHKDELLEVEKFLRSPFHNTSEDCCKLFRQLCKYHPAMESPRLTKETLFAKVFGKSAFDDGKMRKLMTRLTTLLERFLSLREMEKSAETKSMMLIRALEGRSDYGLYKTVVESRISELEQGLERGKDFFWQIYRLYQSLHFHPETSKFTVRHDYFQRYVTHLECFFTLATLQNGIELLIRQRTLKFKEHIYYHNAANDIASIPEMASEQVLSFFHQIFRLYYSPNEEVDMDRMRESLAVCFDKMGFDEQRMALKMLISFAIPRANDGNLEYSRLIFELYKLGVENDMLTIGENAINTDLFMNIATTSLTIGELEWTKEFMDKNGDRLAEEDRFLALQYCRANWYYHNGLHTNDINEFDKSLQAINLIPVRASENFDLRARSLQMRVKYETYKRGADILDNVLALAKNFRRHIAANPTYSEAKKETYTNFIKHYTVLSRLTNVPDVKSADVEKAISDLHSDKNCMQRRWLDEKLKELL